MCQLIKTAVMSSTAARVWIIFVYSSDKIQASKTHFLQDKHDPCLEIFQQLRTLTWPSSCGSPSTCPVNTPRQIRMELNWPIKPRMCLGEISPRYMGSALRAIPSRKTRHIWVMFNESSNFVSYRKLCTSLSLNKLITQNTVFSDNINRLLNVHNWRWNWCWFIKEHLYKLL